MKRAIPAILFITVLLLIQRGGFAQHSNKIDSLFAKGDTTAIMDSLMNGFDEYLDSLLKPKSYFSVIAGVGNRTFSVKNNSLNTQETTRQLSFTPTVGYYHKSGLGIGVTGFMANVGSGFHAYQYAITPSYDYLGDKISAGISYTRYVGKDTTILNASPYDNDVYGYLNFRRKTWRFGIAAGYATGNFSDKLTYQDSVQRYSALLQRMVWIRVNKTIETNNHIKDYSLSLSARKDFAWYNVLAKNDLLTASVTTYLVSGASKIKTNTNINYALKKVTLAKFKRSYSSADGNDFQFQSAALSVSIYYNIGKFSVLPVWFMDYYFPDTDQKFSQVFSLSLAYSF